jgi:hypothetical protein
MVRFPTKRILNGLNFYRVAAADLHEGTADSQERRDSAAGGGRQQEAHAQLCHRTGQPHNFFCTLMYIRIYYCMYLWVLAALRAPVL